MFVVVVIVRVVSRVSLWVVVIMVFFVFVVNCGCLRKNEWVVVVLMLIVCCI